MTRSEPLRVLVFGAHPDDPDISAGGTVALWTQAGHHVRLISLTNGDAGHHALGGAPLAWRRRQEAANAGSVLGAEYLTLDHHDGALEPTLALRAEVIRLIRTYRPDLILAPRPWDYHPDHRATGQVVQDAAYLLTVPNVVSDAPHLAQQPVIALLGDRFSRPVPFAPDVVVDTDAVLERKIDAVACHESQVYEWLPYNRGALDAVPGGAAERRAWLGSQLRERFAQPARTYRDLLAARYGAARAAGVASAEAFEVSEYGHRPTPEEVERLFPF